MKIAVMAAAILALGGLSACETTQSPSGGAVRYNKVTGNLNALVEAPLERVWSAARAGIAELEFKPGSESKDALTGILSAKTADNSDVKVRLEKRTENTTDVTVSVGPFGREAAARELMERIKSKL